MDSAEAKAIVDHTSSEPPCHQHAESPSKGSQVPSHAPSHDGTSPCNQAQVIKSDLSVGGKVTLPLVAILPHTIENLTIDGSLVRSFNAGRPPDLPPAPALISVLRI